MQVHCNKYFIGVISLLIMFSAGCSSNQTVKDTWKGTKDLYRSYLNVPASVDLEDRVDLEDADSHLAMAAEKVNLELDKLARWLENSPSDFDTAWVKKTLARFPWLSGLAIADASGDVINKQAQGFMKELSVAPLLKADPKQSMSALRAYVQSSPLGYEIYLGNPIHYGEEFRGIMVAFFDLRNLIGASPEPERLIVASANEVIWPGVYVASGLPLKGEEWSQMLNKRQAGNVTSSQGSLKWTSRYFGNLLLAYAVVEKGSFTENKEQMAGIDKSIGRHYGVGDTPLPNLNNSLENMQADEEGQRPNRANKGNGINDVGNIGQPNVHPQAPAKGQVKEAPPVKTAPVN